MGGKGKGDCGRGRAKARGGMGKREGLRIWIPPVWKEIDAYVKWRTDQYKLMPHGLTTANRSVVLKII